MVKAEQEWKGSDLLQGDIINFKIKGKRPQDVHSALVKAINLIVTDLYYGTIRRYLNICNISNPIFET